MKCLFILIFLIICLSACTTKNELSISDELDFEILVSSQEANDAVSRDTQLDEQADEEYVIEPEKLINNSVLDRLAQMGITVSIENIICNDSSSCQFTLLLQTEAGKMEIPLSGQRVKSSSDGWITAVNDWNGIRIVSESTIAAVTSKDITFINSKDLIDTGLHMDFSKWKDSDYLLMGVQYHPAIGYVVPIQQGAADSIAYFDEEGRPIKSEVVLIQSGGGAGPGLFFSKVDNRYMGGPLSLREDFRVYGSGPFTIIFPSPYTNGKLLYDSVSSKLWQVMARFEDMDDEKNAGIYEISDYTHRYTDLMVDTYQYWAVYKSPDENYMFAVNGGELFYLTGVENLTSSFDKTKPVVNIYDEMRGLCVYLDFKNSSVQYEYRIQEKQLDEYIIAKSPDGRYQLRNSCVWGGGDAGFSDVVLQDIQTGNLRFLCHAGGMWGGSQTTGFLSNGDVYILDLDFLNIIDVDPTKSVQSLAMPLGKLENSHITRYLFTFRRDPVTKNFIVLYADFPPDWNHIDIGDGRFTYKEGHQANNYIVGFCDSKGNLLESYDTGLPVHYGYWGFYNMDFALSEEDLTITGEHRKSGRRTEGVFNMKTHVFTLTLDGCDEDERQGKNFNQ